MKQITIILLAALLPISAAAQMVDTTTAVKRGKLDFEHPRFLVDAGRQEPDYFSSVKAHLSKEARKDWKPEFSLRANVELFDCSVIMTGGIKTSPYKVFGLGVGWGQKYYRLSTGSLGGERINIALYHRHYLPLGHKRLFTLYSDTMIGASVVYKYSDWYMENGIRPVNGGDPIYPFKPGDWAWWISWQPGIAFVIKGNANVFVGLSVGPVFGMHAGITL